MSKFDKLTEAYLKVVNEGFEASNNYLKNPKIPKSIRNNVNKIAELDSTLDKTKRAYEDVAEKMYLLLGGEGWMEAYKWAEHARGDMGIPEEDTRLAGIIVDFVESPVFEKFSGMY